MDDGINDLVELTIAGQTLKVAQSYEIRQSVLQQPGEFHLRVGQGPTIKEFIQRTSAMVADKKKAPFDPNTDFSMKIAGNPYMTGKTDGYRAEGSVGATELTIFGRDLLAQLHDSHVEESKSFTDATYTSLVKEALTAVGLNASKLDSSGQKDLANRKIQSGVPIRSLLPSREIDEILADVPGKGLGQTTAAISQVIQAKAGERWFEFLRRYLDRAGLMLWAGADGSFILSSPDPMQDPIYRVERQRGQTRNQVNVINADLLYDARPRFSFINVYGRGGGRIKGRTKSKGNTVDDEMVNILGYNVGRGMIIRDSNCQTLGQAQLLARRKRAEQARHGYQLVYTLAGHSTTALNGNRAVWTPNTTVHVIDDEFGLDRNFWIESVEFRRSPQTTTTLRMMRTEDVLFGSEES